MYLSVLKRQKYQGCDISLEISLGEYGCAYKMINKETEEYRFIYGIESDHCGNWVEFDWATMTKSDFDSLINEEWFDANGVKSFLGKKEFDFPQDIQSFIQYHGYENIFGSSYGGYRIGGISPRPKRNLNYG